MLQDSVDPTRGFNFDHNLKVARNDATGINYIEGYHRKKAGRPRGNKQAPSIIIHGNLMQSAMMPGFTHEFLISTPLVRTFTLLRTLLNFYKINMIVLQFRVTGLYICEHTAQKHRGKAGHLSFFFDARYIHHYYCERPINLCVGREAFFRSLSILKSETHFVLLRVRPDASKEDNHILETNVHMPSNTLDEMAQDILNVRAVDDSATLFLPPVDEYYWFAFKTANSTFRNFSQGGERNYLRIMKSVQTPLTVSQAEGDSQRLVTPDSSSNICYNRIRGDSVLSILMPINIMQPFCQQSDISNNVKVSLHPIDPIVLSYDIENTHIETQYEGTKGHSFPACRISIYAHHMSDDNIAGPSS